MTPLPSSVRRLRLAVRCDSASDALALRGRLGDLNRSQFIPVLEKVLAEASQPDGRIRLQKIHVNLGTFSPDEVETLAASRLRDALTDALRDALRDIGPQRSTSRDSDWLALFETYLLSGGLPFWAPNVDAFSPNDIFTDLAERQGGELASLFRRLGHNHEALDRTVHQLFPEQLAALVSLLEPAQAALILGYRAEVVATHRVERLTDLADAPFSHLLWILIFNYLLQDPGSQFNRRTFVRSLLTGIAEHAGVSYIEILAILAHALEQLPGRAGMRSSLPAVIGELVEEASPAPGQPPATLPFPAVRAEDADSVSGPELQTLASLLFPELPRNSTSRELAERLRSMVNNRPAMERLVRRLSPEEFRTVVRLLEPVHAQIVLAYMSEVATVNRTEPENRLVEKDFEFLLRQLVLSYLLREPGSQFNRKAFVNSLVAGIAAHNGVSFEQILTLLGKGLQSATDPNILRSSLPGIIRELLQEAGTRQADAVAGTAAEARRMLSQLMPELANPAAPVAQAFENALAQVADRHDLILRVTASVRKSDVVDFEKLVAETNARANPGIAGTSPHSMASLRRAVLAAIASPASDPDEVHTILSGLLRRDLRAGRRFLHDQMTRSAPREALLRSLAPTNFQSLLHLVLGRPSLPLSILAKVCRQLPLADRPTAAVIHGAILAAVVRREPLDESAPELYAEIVRAIFPVPLPNRIRQALAKRIPASQTLLDAILTENHAARSEPGSSADAEIMPQVMVDRLFDADTEEAFVAFLRALATASRNRAADLRHTLRKRLTGRAALDRLSRTLAPAAMAELVEAIEPNAGAALVSGATLLTSALKLSFPNSPLGDSAFGWNAVLEIIIVPGMSASRMLALLLEDYIDALSAPSSGADSRVSESEDASVFLRHVARVAADAGHAGLLSALEARSSANAQMTPASKPPAPLPPRVPAVPRPVPVTRRENSLSSASEPLFVSNAGLVLVSPFLPTLFNRLGMLEPTPTGRSQWRGPHAASRAVHLLQYLVDGRTAAPEPRLVWNKVLCGLQPSAPVERAIEASSPEIEACNELLAAVLANWPALSKTSVAALRETFLQRQGKLERTADRCALLVQRKTVDVLLDRVEWGFRFVFHAWMEEPVYVTW